jgi:7-carboxy-7-deazaguanine synthase
MKKLPIIEMFGPTIQGEGIPCGSQTFFIRLGLCDFACKKCDSWHAVDPKNVKKLAEYISADALFERFIQYVTHIKKLHIKNITLSGGNPAIHKDLNYFVDEACTLGYNIYVETQGSIYQPWMEKCHVTISPKSPGMGETFNPEAFLHFMKQLKSNDWSIKIPVFSALDLEFAVGVKRLLNENTYNLRNRFFLSLGNPYPPKYHIDVDDNVIETFPDDMPTDLNNFLLQRYRELADQIMQDHRLGDVKFLPQLHVLTYGNKQGY